MDRDMVIYAKGRPPRKIRDKDDKGVDYEEWIYGNPPEEVQFVRFQGQFVSRLETMTVDGQKIVKTEREVDLKSAETELAEKKAQDPSRPTRQPYCGRVSSRNDKSSQNAPNTPYPPAVDTSSPGAPPPQWRLSAF